MTIELWNCTCGATGMKGKFCTKCGKKYETIQDELAIAKAERVSVETENGWTCPACGATGQKRKFCTKCGQKFSESLTNEEKNVVNESENKKNNYVTKQLEYEAADSFEKTSDSSTVEKAIGSIASKFPHAEEIGDKLKNGMGELQEQIKKQDIESKIREGIADVRTEVNSVQTKFADGFTDNNSVIKKYLPFVLIAIIIAGGGWYFMNNKTDTKKVANNIKIETSKKADGNANKKISEEASLSGNENGVKAFASRLEAKNKEAKEKANSLIWLTTKMYKRGNDVIVEGAYYNGSGQTIDYETDMTMEISFYGKGKEVGHLKDVTFNKAPTKGLLSGKKKKVRYEVKGKANEVGEFSTFEVTTKVKKSN